ncbi:hypothetical protein N0V93_008025 [Gnomoniopsis smithogilvyi]|uniref:Acyltransferase 3 domain-containing protein n=1 Tax=Gnomoniopsis smithogilvyi TaxID=1191159 RepID=A0A9W8YM59_9PEZI|nr:hypothetical protein N0V93_008025 [Gnomoniopsis smithogilvyi]
MAIGREGNVKWVDGLRGIASALVVLTHLCRAWDMDLFSSTDHEHTAPRFLQWPYLRILIQGRIGVTIFAFVTGYVCALKPIKLYKAGNQEAALISISKSALRRFPRLFLPAAAATVVSFFMCEMGLYTIAKHADSWWVDVNSPVRTPWLGEAVGRLVYNIVTTWTRKENNYDQNQWTLLPLLAGSMWVYAFIVATAYVKPRFRMLASLGLWVYFWLCSDSAFGMQFFWGTLIADLQNSDTAAALVVSRPRTSAVLSGVLVFFGLTIASFPEGNAEWMTWSRVMLNMMRPILPAHPDFPRFSSGIGLEFITLGVLLSPTLQRLLSNRYLLFLGRMSFAVYLLHGTLLKTTLVWMIYGVQTLPDHEDSNGNMVMTRLRYPGHISLIAWQIVWLPMLYGIASLWTTYVDPWCDRMTNKLVERITFDGSEKISTLPMR